MASTHAKQVFRTKLAPSCAQAIYRGFQEECSVSEETIQAASAFGGGRSPGGTCGALYAALDLAPENAHSKMMDAFVEHGGSTQCRGLKSERRLDCPACVALAADLLEEVL